jgi:prepilin-type processing-associated H-X9-DG protein
MPPPNPVEQLSYQPPRDYARLPLSVPAALSVVFGALLPVFPLISGIVAIFLARVGLKQTKIGERRGRGAAVTGMVLGIINVVIGPILIVVIVLGVLRARDVARSVQSASHLRSIGIALQMYAMDNRGFLPPDLDALITPKPYASPSFFRSPRVPANKPLMTLSFGGCDYVYGMPPAGRLPGVRSPSTTPIAYEPPANYGNKQTNVLFADNHVEAVKPPVMQQLIGIVDANRAAAGATTMPATPSAAPGP